MHWLLRWRRPWRMLDEEDRAANDRRGKDEDIIDEYELLEDYIDTEVLELKYATGRKSKALFERKYCRVVILQYDHLEDLKRQ
ncbi:hypothetical protein MMC22_001553 [Lobaria immixta]|nr:hypothetical protein [Lobaria immixta]